MIESTKKSDDGWEVRLRHVRIVHTWFVMCQDNWQHIVVCSHDLRANSVSAWYNKRYPFAKLLRKILCW